MSPPRRSHPHWRTKRSLRRARRLGSRGAPPRWRDPRRRQQHADPRRRRLRSRRWAKVADREQPWRQRNRRRRLDCARRRRRRRRPGRLDRRDLSFFHDLNGLLAATKFDLDATVVVLNNDGGGIFSFLPQAEQLDAPTFEALFGTPTGLDVAAAARLFEASHARPGDWGAFRRELVAPSAAAVWQSSSWSPIATAMWRSIGRIWAAVAEVLPRVALAGV